MTKTVIFYQTNEFDSATGAMYYWSKILQIALKGVPIWKDHFVHQQTIVLTFTWWNHEERKKFYQEMCSDGARTFKYIGSDYRSIANG